VVERPGNGRGRVPLASVLRSETVQVLIALGLGAVLAVVLFGDLTGQRQWRLIVLPVALLLVIRGLVGLLLIGRAEWRREPTGARNYLLVVLRFAGAYVVVAAAMGA
jgi:hypothetical protein